MKPDRHQLQAARTLAKLTLFEVANAVGLGRSRLARIEDGSAASPAPELIDRLTAFYERQGVIFRIDGRVEMRSDSHKAAENDN